METRIYIQDGKIVSVDGCAYGKLLENGTRYEINDWILTIQGNNIDCKCIRDRRGVEVVHGCCSFTNGFVVLIYSPHILDCDVRFYPEHK